MTAKWDDGTRQSPSDNFVDLVIAEREVTVTAAILGFSYDGHVYQMLLNHRPEDDTTRITITKDERWVGDGRLLESGHIDFDDCPATLGDDVYEAIEIVIKERWHGPQTHKESRRR